jgi:hypothetical protein
MFGIPLIRITLPQFCNRCKIKAAELALIKQIDPQTDLPQSAGETLSLPSYAGKLRKMPPTTCEIPITGVK